MGDAMDHTSMMADILGGVLEVAANIAITALATAAVVAATGITVVTGGLGCFLLGAVVGVVVGLAMSKSGADKGLSNLCEGIGNALFPPTVQANILKEDQGQNTCIFSTEFALKMMGDIQQYFVDHQVRNFYSVSIAPSTPPRSAIFSNSASTASSSNSVNSSMMKAPWLGFSFLAKPHSRLMIS